MLLHINPYRIPTRLRTHSISERQRTLPSRIRSGEAIASGQVTENRWIWAIAAACMVAALAILLLAMGPSYIMAPWDVFILLGEAWRIISGQIPHTDFHNPVGPLSYSLIALGMRIGDISLAGYVYGNVVFLLIVSSWGGAVFFSRMRPIYAFLSTLFIAALSVATRPLGYDPSVTSYAMIYNRYGWILLAVAFVQLFVAPEKESANKTRADAASIGLLLGLLFYCKISYFVLGVAGLALASILRAPIRKGLVFTAAGFALVCIAAWITLGVLPTDYVKDVLAAGQAQSFDGRLWRVVKAVAHNFWQVPLAGVIWLLLAVEPAWRNKADWRSAFELSLVYFFILGAALILTVSNAVERSDVPFFFVAGIILLQQSERTWALAPPSERKAKNWKYIASTAIVVFGFFANIVVKDIWSIGNSFTGSLHAESVENKTQEFDSARLQDFRIPETSQWRTAYWQANEVPADINDGLRLLRRHVGKNDQIVVLALTDPFSFALGLVPPEDVPLWWDLNYSFNESVHPSPERLFGNADFVVYPILRESDKGCCKETVEMLLKLYGNYIKGHFVAEERSLSWALLRRSR